MNAPTKAVGQDEAGSGSHPSGDDRFARIDEAMRRHRFEQDALIEVLHAAQEHFGYLRADLLQYIAHGLKLPPSRVHGVATFYHLFTLTPRGKHTCVVCTGTACYVRGVERLLAAIESETGAVPGRTTPDGRITLEVARCVGACGIAPVVVFDGNAEGSQTAESALDRIRKWNDHGEE